MPSRWASSPMASCWNPTSSASSAAAAITSWRLSPALGTLAPLLFCGPRRRSSADAIADEGRDEPGDLLGALGVRIVPGPLEHRDGAEPGRHRGRDPVGLGPGVGPVG